MYFSKVYNKLIFKQKVQIASEKLEIKFFYFLFLLYKENICQLDGLKSR